MRVNILYPFNMSFLDYPTNDDCCILVFMMGCINNCEKCQNKKFQNPNRTQNTKEFTPKKLYEELISSTNRFHTRKVVLTGGDPLSPYNVDFTKMFLLNYGQYFEICIYSGHTIDYIKRLMLINFEYLVSEKYIPSKAVQSLKTNSYFQLASTNQKIWDSKFNILSNNGIMYFKK